MKAWVFSSYGSPEVLEWQEVPKPSPKEDEVLIRVHAVSLNDWDGVALRGDSFVNRLIFGLLRPKEGRRILGSDVAGRVEAVGRNVVRYKAGDEVFGDLSGRWGGFAEYVCAPETAVVFKGSGMTFEQAAAIPQAGLLALQALRLMGGVRAGQSLLINDAGGGVGTFALQIAQHDGAKVTVVDSAAKLDRLRALGATQVIDYAREDFTRNGQRYDLILDVKTGRSVFELARALKPDGIYVTVGGSMARLFQTLLVGPWIRLILKKHLRLLALKPNQGLEDLKALFEAGQLTPVIEGPYSIREVPQTFRRFGEGLHFGKIVITLETS